jgi:rhamnosyltransferase
MKENLFIDHVDTDWSIRVKQAGFTLWGLGKELMAHNLGGCSISVLGRKVPLHKPLRYYYIVRNGFSLAFSKTSP